MQTFKGMKNLETLSTDAEEKGWEVDKTEFEEKGSDWIYLRDMDVRFKQIALNTFNGHFFVYEPFQDTPTASHLSTEFDEEEWYQEILNLLYEKEEVVNE